MSTATMNPDTRRRRRNGSRHDKTGCLTCRYRRKKCTENTFPVCGSCSRLHLRCVREPVRDVVPSNWIPQELAEPPRISPPPRLAHGSVETPRKRQILRYYVTQLAPFLAVTEQVNSYLSAFLPMAMESTALFDALIAFAAGHLALIDQSYKVIALESRSAAISNLSIAIGTPSTQMCWHELNAATCLTFMIWEAGMGDCNGWYSHLQGTKHIITSAAVRSSSGTMLNGPEAFMGSPEGREILRNFAYHDIVGSVTLRKRPLINGDYLENMPREGDSYLDVAAELLSFIARISHLDEEMRVQQTMAGEESQRRAALFHSTCGQMEKQLRDWECHPDTAASLRALAYAYRSAVLIYLYRLIRSRLQTDGIPFCGTLELETEIQPKIQSEVEQILFEVSKIPMGAAPESAFSFPLFMAGGEAREAEHINTIRSRLSEAIKKRLFQNMSKALEVLEDLWALRESENGANMDWTHILDASGVSLLLT